MSLDFAISREGCKLLSRFYEDIFLSAFCRKTFSVLPKAFSTSPALQKHPFGIIFFLPTQWWFSEANSWSKYLLHADGQREMRTDSASFHFLT